MESIDFFVQIQGFFTRNIYQPCELAIAQINDTKETQLFTIDLSDEDFTSLDKITNLKLYQKEHGIVPPHAVAKPKYFKVHKYDDLKRILNIMFHLDNCQNEYYPTQTFAVKGNQQFCTLNNIMMASFTSDHIVIVNVEEEFDWHENVPTSPEAPHFHSHFHHHGLSDQCAGKIAWTYADCIRDKIRCSESGINVGLMQPQTLEEDKKNDNEMDKPCDDEIDGIKKKKSKQGNWDTWSN